MKKAPTEAGAKFSLRLWACPWNIPADRPIAIDALVLAGGLEKTATRQKTGRR
jgi:hypothetical protein